MSQYLDKDGASRIAENFLSKQAEQDAILRNLQFDLKEAEHALVKTIQGPAPLNIRALTRPLDDYRISGNMIQNGTPTPSAPIYPEECGERTENLVDPTVRITDANITTVGRIESYMAGYYDVGYFPIIQGNKYTIDSYVYAYFYTIPTLGSTAYGNMRVVGELGEPSSFTAPITGYCCFRVDSGDSFMANNGESALPYEPYGYKLPLTVNGTEYPIYLGQVPTTRQIKKLVLTGEESTYTVIDSKAHIYTIRGVFNTAPQILQVGGYCTHYKYNNAISSLSANMRNDDFVLNKILNSDYSFAIKDDTLPSISGFQSYIAAQYAAGTPVTIWYVLAEPETGIVNEPLHKIGDYADTVSMAQAGVEISTTKGFNTITTDTTVLPSNIEVKGVINNA